MDFDSIFKKAEKNRMDFEISVKIKLFEALEECHFKEKILEASKEGKFYIFVNNEDAPKLKAMLDIKTMTPYYCKKIAEENKFKIKDGYESIMITFGEKQNYDY
jgi:hypothetical protein